MFIDITQVREWLSQRVGKRVILIEGNRWGSWPEMRTVEGTVPDYRDWEAALIVRIDGQTVILWRLLALGEVP